MAAAVLPTAAAGEGDREKTPARQWKEVNASRKRGTGAQIRRESQAEKVPGKRCASRPHAGSGERQCRFPGSYARMVWALRVRGQLREAAATWRRALTFDERRSSGTETRERRRDGETKAGK